jgi:hypothetical protein
MTKQSVFTRVATHLLNQNAKSVPSGKRGSCRYRGANGMRCAIGCLIDDAHYRTGLEGLAVGNHLVRDAVRASGVIASSAFLARLQMVHDGSEPHDWLSRLTEIAKDHHLKMPAEAVALVMAYYNDEDEFITPEHLEVWSCTATVSARAQHVMTQAAATIRSRDAVIYALVGALLEAELVTMLGFSAFARTVDAALTLAGLDTAAKRDAERERRKR